MVARFDTSGIGGGGSSQSKGGNGLLIFALIVAGGYLAWNYLIKPEMDKRKAEKEQKH